jgi:hypothetical protein
VNTRVGTFMFENRILTKLASWFASNGIKVILYDQRGFGYSGGPRGHSTIEEMHLDLHAVVGRVPRKLPAFIYCHSLATSIVFRYLIHYHHQLLHNEPIIQVPRHHRNQRLRSSTKTTEQSENGHLADVKFDLSCTSPFNDIKDIQVNSYLDPARCSKSNFHLRKVVQDELLWPFLSIRMAYNILKLGRFLHPNCHK